MEILSNPVVAVIGYILTVISGLIAIKEYFAKKEAESIIFIKSGENITLNKKVSEFKSTITQLQAEVNIQVNKNNLTQETLNEIKIENKTLINKNKEVSQGDKSQYFEKNNGMVSIDNRG